MSAEPSLQRPTADSGVSGTDAASGKSSGGNTPAGSETGRTRQGRRGRRRRGRRSGRGGQAQQQQPSATQTTTTDAPSTSNTPPKSAPKPGSHRPNSQKPGGPKPHGQKPGSTKSNGAKSSGAKSNGAKSSGQKSGGPKPGPNKPGGQKPGTSRKGGGQRGSGGKANGNQKQVVGTTVDLSAPDVQEANSPASMPRTRRRTARRSEAPETTPRLHTVRETSSGGLVLSDIDAPFSELSAALIGRIDRRGRMMWSLPKGHIETGETAEQTAMREVAEETGIEGTIVAPLGKIDYWFVSEGRRIHKTVHHYLLRFTGGELSDADYEVSAVAWVPLTELPRRLTYSDERRLARMAESVIADLQSDPDRLAKSEASCLRTEPNDYEKAAAARNQRRNEPPPAPKPRRRRRRPRRAASGES
ncbi:MAG: NUDIX hydrolase [Gordonia sp. (in: high G+C Gram-positive bacteria)]|uniref:NUDIX hydrolase n=1 Tax=Gordonia sp. (in: high G+C Gram-positive bacteria) TaxID=84139 RepID=UPI003C70E278